MLACCAVLVPFFTTPSSLDELPLVRRRDARLFFFAGIGNASTFKQMPMLFPPRQAGGVIGFTAPIAAYGPFIFGLLIRLVLRRYGNPNAVFYGLAAFFADERRAELVALRPPRRRQPLLNRRARTCPISSTASASSSATWSPSRATAGWWTSRAAGRTPTGALGARQDRALHPRRELHRLLLLEDLRQGRRGDLGDAADRLSAHAARPAEPRAARLRARRQLFLVPLQREPREVPDDAQAPAAPVAQGEGAACRPRAAWAASRTIRRSAANTSKVRGLGGFVRVTWEEAEEMIAAANVHTAKQHGPGPRHRLLADPGDEHGQLRRGQPLPVADRRRLHVLLRLVLRPASVLAADLGRADRRAGIGRLVQCRLHHDVGLQRAADAHAGRPLHDRGALRGAKTVVVTPDYSEASKFADLWLHPKQGTDAALALAMGHVILNEWHAKGRGDYFLDYCRRYTDMPMLVLLTEKDGRLVADRSCAPPTSPRAPARRTTRTGRPSRSTTRPARLYVPTGSIGFRWGEQGKWNLEGRDARTLEASRRGCRCGRRRPTVGFPYFGDGAPEFFNPTTLMTPVLTPRVPVRRSR
jgi:hypothetical protein